MTKLLALTLVAVTAFGLGACTRATDLPPGEYHKSQTSTDSHGTNYKTDTTTNVEVDRYGKKRATTETTTSKDPEGLMNKSTSTKKTTVHE